MKDQKLKKALKLYQLDKNKDAIAILESEVFFENPDALSLLGDIYYSTSKSCGGVSRSLSKARKYWLKASSLDNVSATRELASMYYFGEGVKPNNKKAEHYWQKAADIGDALAKFNLANFYYDEAHDKIDRAIVLYNDLIGQQEFVENCYLKLGRIFYRGLGVERDAQKAFDWLSKGAKIEHGLCCMDLSLMYYRGEATKKDKSKAISLVMTASQTDWLKEDAIAVAELMRKGSLLN